VAFELRRLALAEVFQIPNIRHSTTPRPLLNLRRGKLDCSLPGCGFPFADSGWARAPKMALYVIAAKSLSS
jgi:hypothetical protein